MEIDPHAASSLAPGAKVPFAGAKAPFAGAKAPFGGAKAPFGDAKAPIDSSQAPFHRLVVRSASPSVERDESLRAGPRFGWAFGFGLAIYLSLNWLRPFDQLGLEPSLWARWLALAAEHAGRTALAGALVVLALSPTRRRSS